MVTAKDGDPRKSEYVIVKLNMMYYYARASRTDDNTYEVVTNVGEKEGQEIIKKANETSTYVKWYRDRTAAAK